jgi:hypothetical protein
MKKLFDRLKSAANRPRRTLTRKALMNVLGTQTVVVLVATIVVSVWPYMAMALGPVLLLSTGVIGALFLEAYEGRLGRIE